MKGYVFASLLVIVVLRGTSGKIKEAVSVHEYRSYARTLVIDLACNPSCSKNITWKFKKHDKSVWNDVKNVTQHRNHTNLYYLRGFLPNSEYDIQVLDDEKNYTSMKPLHTCGENPPDITDLYVATSGTGWLDIRWTHPKEKCKSEMKYMLRYKAWNASYKKEKQYGFFEIPRSHGGPTPYHPCMTWPDEFCALLTDHVQPGKKHIVQVRALRMDPENPESLPSSKWKSVIAFADAMYDENILPKKCDTPMKIEGEVETSRNFRTDGLAMQLWVVSLLGILIVVAVIITLCATKKAWMTGAISPASCDNIRARNPTLLSSNSSVIYDYPRLRLQNLTSTFRRRSIVNIPLCENQTSVQ